ncbi:MAG: LiaF domain-containing protein [Thermoanaerobaculia bacterium]
MTGPIRRGFRGERLDRFFFGILVMAGGVVFLLDRLELVDAWEVLYWWPLALILGGVISLLDRKFLTAFFWFALGTAFLLPKAGIPFLNIGDVMDLFPLTITFAGVALILQAIRPVPKDVFGEAPAGFRAAALMAGNTRTIRTPAFLGGDVFAVMGGCDIDLRAAKIQGDEAVIDVLAFWGGIDIKVPREWTVVNRVTALLGGVSNLTEPGREGAPRLVLRGAAIMGGVEVRAYDDE